MTYTKKFPSGLRLVVKPIDGLLSVSMGIFAGTGSSFESESENGISHFIEHMMFKGTQKRNAFEISDAMDKIGAQVNAFTSKEITCFYARSTSDHAGEAFEILSDFVLNATFPEEEMDREKGVVCEEIAMTEDTPDDLCFDILGQAYFGDVGYGRTILGPAENVKGFTRDDLYNYIQERYNPENLVVSIVGKIDVQYAEDLVWKLFESKLEKRVFVPRNKIIEYRSDNLYKTKDIEQVHIAFAWPSVAREDELVDATQLINAALGGGMSSRLFQTVREKMGLAYTVYSFLSAFTEGGFVTVYAGVNPKNLQKAQDAIMQTIAELRRDNITKDEFLRGKEQLKSSLILAQENTATQMVAYGKYLLFNDKVLDLDQRVKDIENVTKEDCEQALLRNFDMDKIASAVVGKVEKPLTIH